MVIQSLGPCVPSERRLLAVAAGQVRPRMAAGFDDGAGADSFGNRFRATQKSAHAPRLGRPSWREQMEGAAWATRRSKRRANRRCAMHWAANWILGMLAAYGQFSGNYALRIAILITRSIGGMRGGIVVDMVIENS